MFTDLLHRYLDRPGGLIAVMILPSQKKAGGPCGEGEKVRRKGRERSSCYSQGTSEDSQQVWAGSEQEASRALQ